MSECLNSTSTCAHRVKQTDRHTYKIGKCNNNKRVHQRMNAATNTTKNQYNKEPIQQRTNTTKNQYNKKPIQQRTNTTENLTCVYVSVFKCRVIKCRVFKCRVT